MEITLEQIELVKDRTGASYKDAKEALEFANGNVVDAIIYIEENINGESEDKGNSTVETIVKAIKDAVHTGNVTKVRIYKGEDLVVNIPVTVGTIAAVVFPWGVVAAAVASAATKCRVELVKEDGSVVDINGKASDIVNTVKDKGGVVVDEIKVKGGDFCETAKSATASFYEEAKVKGSEIYENAKSKVQQYFSEKEGDGIIDITDIDFEEEGSVDGSVDSCDDCSDNQ